MDVPLLDADADVRSLPHGTRVGPWRLKGGRGIGAYGAVYRAERVGHEEAGDAALKMALHPRDPRFKREAEMLRRTRHPNVPRLLDSGEWRHPNGFHHPFIVMERIDGEPLYAWAERRNPDTRQVLRLLAQAARALQATHEAGGVHRDVKGDNVLVRPVDEWLFLMDFGAGDYVGAERLTASRLPPGTPPYRSPEAWAASRNPWRKPHERYVAGPADDVFALGVMAYRLVTDEYPPFTDASSEEGQCWQPGGSGPRPPSEVNSRVGPELDAVIQRMLSLNPKKRGTAQELAEVMEQSAAQVRSVSGEGLFQWETPQSSAWSHGEATDVERLGHRLRRRNRKAVLAAVDADATKRATVHRQQAVAGAKTALRGEREVLRAQGLSGFALMAATALAVLLLWLQQRESLSSQEGVPVARGTRSGEQRDGGVTHVGDTAVSAVSSGEQSPMGKGVAVEAPPKPFPGQLRPDLNGRCRKGQYSINGGCWLRVEVSDLEDCKGVKNGVEFEQSCYTPIFPSKREPTSAPVSPVEPER
ncbi:serine/threonine protein kinase [Hyalangium minutum]|uniref:non-specific serine/threonine protein kinase n=1 Tax=Hyalangium minutum TaxID=394096 RepID=A0A085WMZ6_9BACT|nr:serine/threonine-protein kinase [Hyalangium minutum]KFE69059.1 hypothetical protein DB31_6961 [Hyalangium minutum]